MRMYYEVNTDVGLNELFLVICILFLSRGCSLPIPHQGLLWWPECSRVTSREERANWSPADAVDSTVRGQPWGCEEQGRRTMDMAQLLSHCKSQITATNNFQTQERPHRFKSMTSAWILFWLNGTGCPWQPPSTLSIHEKRHISTGVWGVRRGAYCKAIEYWNTTNSFEFLSMPFRLYLPPTSPTITYTYYS